MKTITFDKIALSLILTDESDIDTLQKFLGETFTLKELFQWKGTIPERVISAIRNQYECGLCPNTGLIKTLTPKGAMAGIYRALEIERHEGGSFEINGSGNYKEIRDFGFRVIARHHDGKLIEFNEYSEAGQFMKGVSLTTMTTFETTIKENVVIRKMWDCNYDFKKLTDIPSVTTETTTNKLPGGQTHKLVVRNGEIVRSEISNEVGQVILATVLPSPAKLNGRPRVYQVIEPIYDGEGYIVARKRNGELQQLFRRTYGASPSIVAIHNLAGGRTMETTLIAKR